MHLYAHPASQPSRSVLWLCALNSAFCPVHHDPEKDLGEVNPRRQIPVLDDDGFVLTEMPAIMAYLAGQHGWGDWYPRDTRTRARIDQYLHTHHTLTRLATLQLMAPHVLVAFEQPPLDNTTSTMNTAAIRAAMADPDKLANGQRIVGDALAVLEQHYMSEPGFIGGCAEPSIADLACYEEIAQLEWAGLMDLEPFPRIKAWLARMAGLPHHDALHRFNFVLGNIARTPNTMQRMLGAIGAGLEALGEIGFTLADMQGSDSGAG